MKSIDDARLRGHLNKKDAALFHVFPMEAKDSVLSKGLLPSDPSLRGNSHHRTVSMSRDLHYSDLWAYTNEGYYRPKQFGVVAVDPKRVRKPFETGDDAGVECGAGEKVLTEIRTHHTVPPAALRYIGNLLEARSLVKKSGWNKGKRGGVFRKAKSGKKVYKKKGSKR